ncbi:MAG TPA: hypothetical protein VFU65_18515 [Actinocrinis sp.]|nr:hypothetical protein [Actinocrinis sp.]
MSSRAGDRRSAASAISALTAAFAFGAIDQYLGALSSPTLTELSGMSATWLLVPFLAGAWKTGQLRAALTGLAATWLAVLGYVVMIVSPMEGTHLGPRPASAVGSWNQLTPHLLLTVLASQSVWFVGGLITGPLYGWLGYRWRTRRAITPALLAALPVALEPAARWLSSHFGLARASGLAFDWPSYGSAVIAETAEVALGVALIIVSIMIMLRTREPAAPEPGVH